jgi:hypothetical protein
MKRPSNHPFAGDFTSAADVPDFHVISLDDPHGFGHLRIVDTT